MEVIERAAAEERELTPDEARAYLEAEVQRYLGMGLDQFYKLAEQGKLPNHPAVAHLILLTGAKPTAC